MLSPITANRWDFNAAAHLLVRAGFGGDPSEIDKIQAMGPEKAVDFLVNAPAGNYPAPAWATPDDENELRALVKEAATPEEKQIAKKLLREKFMSEMKDLTHWWLARIVGTSSPLAEKMTLFWHGHFAPAGRKCDRPTKCGGRTKHSGRTRWATFARSSKPSRATRR